MALGYKQLSLLAHGVICLTGTTIHTTEMLIAAARADGGHTQEQTDRGGWELDAVFHGRGDGVVLDVRGLREESAHNQPNKNYRTENNNGDHAKGYQVTHGVKDKEKFFD